MKIYEFKIIVKGFFFRSNPLKLVDQNYIKKYQLFSNGFFGIIRGSKSDGTLVEVESYLVDVFGVPKNDGNPAKSIFLAQLVCWLDLHLEH